MTVSTVVSTALGWLKWLLIGVLGLVILLIVIGATYEMLGRRQAQKNHPPTGKLVDIGGRAIHLDCRGSGSPTVVFEAGSDSLGSLSWSKVHDEIASMTRACAYDRAGIMWSDPKSTLQDGNGVAEDLHAALQAADESGPFVLVAHSLGGPYSMVYTGKYPDQVAGLVFVDPAHPDQASLMDQFEALRTMKQAGDAAKSFMSATAWTGLVRLLASKGGTQEFPADVIERSNAYFSTSVAGMKATTAGFKQAMAQAGAQRSLGARPLIVLGSPALMDEKVTAAIGMTDGDAERFNAGFRKLQEQEASLSTRGRYQAVANTGHYIQFDQPNVVVSAVREVLDAVRADAPSAVSAAPAPRPQEPKKPYPYREEEVSYRNVTARIQLGGTLTLPQGTGPFAAVLLITGSGPQDRDETLVGHKPFLLLADYLTRRGIAVLRVDDRGVGASGGDFSKSTSADFATDVLAGISFLKARSDIRRDRIGLIGHSEGGMIAPMVATQSADVAFIVMMAGPGVAGEAILLEQQKLMLAATGAPEEHIATNEDSMKQSFAVLREEPDAAKAKVRLIELARRSIATLPETERAAHEKQLDAIVDDLNGPWMRYFLKHDPAAVLRRVTCPVLALNGELDLQVPPQQNLPPIEAALRAGNNRDYTVRELPRLNHLFQSARTGSLTEYRTIEETINPAALDLVGDWVVARASKP